MPELIGYVRFRCVAIVDGDEDFVLDPDGRENCPGQTVSRPPCGGCDRCLIMQAEHYGRAVDYIEPADTCIFSD